MRITRSGLDVLGKSASGLASTLGNFTGGTLSIPIPTATQSGSVSLLGFPVPYSISICPNGPMTTTTPEQCVANVQIASDTLHVDAVTPHAIKLSGNLPMRLQDLPLNASLIGDFAIGFGTGSCNGGTPNFDYGTFPVSVTLPIVTETMAPRAGLSKIDAANADVEITADQSSLGVCKDCGTDTLICQPLINAVKALAFNLVIGQVKTQIKNQLQTAFCTAPNAAVDPSCPTGSSPDANTGATCVYDAAPTTCVPTLLGTDGKVDVSSLLSSVASVASPGSGTTANVDFLLAAGGALNPAPGSPADNTGYAGHTPNGATLPLLGGLLPETISPCVPAADIAKPTGIPLPTALTVDTAKNWPTGLHGPDLGIAMSGRYLDYALGGVYQSGALCLDIDGGKIALLNTGLLSLLAPSVPSLTFEGKAASILARLRPLTPPTIAIGSGTDTGANAIMTVDATDFAVDLYVYSDDRYLRALTFESNLTLPLGLTTGVTAKNPTGGLMPVLGTPAFNDPRVLNSELLTDSPTALAGGVSVALSALIGQILGSKFPAIDLSSALSTFGLTMSIPASGIQKVTQGTDDFVAIFASLAPTAAMGKHAPGTRLELVHLDINPSALTLANARRDLLPKLSMRFVREDGSKVAHEYAWWLDDGTRSAWSENEAPVLTGDAFFLQGKHTLQVAAREVGKPETEEAPVSMPVLIDVRAPVVTFNQMDTGTSLSAADLVTATSDLELRFRRVTGSTAGEWSAWGDLQAARAAASAAAASPTSNAGVTRFDVEARDEAGNVGSASQTASGATAVSASEGEETAASDGGCSVTGTGTGTGSRTSGDASSALFLTALAGFFVASRTRKRLAAAAAATASLVACGGDTLDGFPIDAGAADATTPDGSTPLAMLCGADCKQTCKPALDEGLVGAYSSLAAASDGTVWMSAYSDAVIKGGSISGYGDLVVGRYDAARGAVAWSSIDGVPALAKGTCPDNDPTGWRGGRSGAGDDVGLWTSMAIGANGQPMVAYYDATHAALKLATFDGKTWSTFPLTAPSMPGIEDDGRYAKLIVAGGVPVIAYLFQTGTGSAGRSGVRLATSKVPLPTKATDFTIEEVASAAGASTPANASAYPMAYGDYLSLASGLGGTVVAFYDEPNGNLVGAQKTNGAWGTKILDGASGTNNTTDTGNVGRDASLVIDGNGDWHVAYVNDTKHQLLYIKVAGGVTVSTPSVVDDGSTVNGATFSDGVHLIGDDARLSLSASGVPSIVYADSTAGTLRIARATATGATFKWTLTSPSQPGKFAGLFPFALPDGSKIANSYRAVDTTGATAGETRGDVIFAPGN